MHTVTSYPPPLSSPPSVETLERLLSALHRPMATGVPSPPALLPEPEHMFATATRPVPTQRGMSSADLSWSAGTRHGAPGVPVALLAATAAALAAVASVATG